MSKQTSIFKQAPAFDIEPQPKPVPQPAPGPKADGQAVGFINSIARTITEWIVVLMILAGVIMLLEALFMDVTVGSAIGHVVNLERVYQRQLSAIVGGVLLVAGIALAGLSACNAVLHDIHDELRSRK
jgi:hypothetical protein